MPQTNESGERDELGARRAARAGRPAAFDELVRRTYVDTYTLAVRLTGNEEDARDVVQEAYLRAWKGIGRFRGDAQFTTWMYRITANASSHARPEARVGTARRPLDDIDEPIELRLEPRPEASAESAAGLAELAVALDAAAAEAPRASWS